MWFRDRLRATLWRCRLIVWTASWLVPRTGRATWRTEQDSRFFHWCHFLAESGQLTPHNRLAIARACWATFPDAFWKRFDRERFRARWHRFRGSPVTFLGALTLAVLVLVLSTGIINAVRAAFPRRCRTRHARYSSTSTGTVSMASSAEPGPTHFSISGRSGASRNSRPA